jgi:predicted transcriptional regulator
MSRHASGMCVPSKKRRKYAPCRRDVPPEQITDPVKADDNFDAALTRLAKRLKTTKSSVIRAAVLNYRDHIEREALRQRIREVSLKSRAQAKQAASDLDTASGDGL